ncbi:undecaprenyldiphospho-muramoylpentapeptide beta-N-acetylglucosaminyltransferase [Dehalobacter sp. TBBPA1]|uniref:undecaprenyldiphospho-muramoylpentapeptide beta-N-acetylglucosaminyltransferase n=1 Tax=Dehalobacter sp. TBBPA1 TaxID=3235037 RepID=UPI0034A277F8
MRVIVTGGGTGGHIYPAMAIAKALQERLNDIRILYVGTRSGMEAKLAPENGLEFRGISGQGMPRQLSTEVLKAAGTNVKALWETKRILKEFDPDLVVGTGGYVSGPVVLTAAFFGIPTVLHEQNAFPGKTNKILARMVKRILLTFPESEKYFGVKDKVKVVGLPVREEIGKIDRKDGAKAFDFDPGKKTILVTGGSRGALSINQALIGLLPKLAPYPDVQLIWATGTATHDTILKELETRNIDWQRKQWKVLAYVEHIPEALACSDLCICRAGASTLAELSAAGKAGILVPYPYAAENHQEYNARAFENKGAACVILDKELNTEILWDNVQKVLLNPFKLEEMAARAKEVFAPGALDCIINLCLQTAWK